jgi:ubiquinone/menaquinone biosynthesis C-methylase UbiE
VSDRDRWADWLLDRRQGGSSAEYERMMDALHPIRDRVLGHAAITPGDTLLDIGSGDGLIALEALYYVGSGGHVILSDVSQALLDYCREEVAALDLTEHATFLRAGVTDLSALDDASVDVVTVRSVLVYVNDKPRAFAEIFRVLAPGGRLSLYEPVARFGWPEPPGTFWGYDVSAVTALAERVKQGFGFSADDPLRNFDERDLMRYADEAGFNRVTAQLEAAITHGAGSAHQGEVWQRVVHSAPNPLAPTLHEVLQRTLTDEERATFRTHLEPEIRLGRRTNRSASVYLQATKL